MAAHNSSSLLLCLDVKNLGLLSLGFKSFWSACCTIAGIEVMHAIRKGQLASTENASQTPAEQFYASAA
jgi:putative transposase